MKKHKLNSQGFVFVFTLVAMLALFLIGAATLTAANNSSRQVAIRRIDAQAVSLAESGALAGHAWLRSQNTSGRPKPNGDDKSYPVAGGWINFSGIGRCRAVIKAVQDPNKAWETNYLILGVGETTREGRTRTVAMWLDPQSFSRYGYFEDTGSTSNWWVSRISQFEGPFHSNGTPTTAGGTRYKMQIQWDGTANPNTEYIFNGDVSSSATGITWKDKTGKTKAPVTDAEWSRVTKGGANSIKLGVDPIPFPDDTTPQKSHAWGGDPAVDGVPAYPTKEDVYIQNSRASGIYIVPGKDPTNVAKVYYPSITYSKGGENIQVITIDHSVYDSVGKKWLAKSTKVTVNLQQGTTLVQTKVGTATSYTTTMSLNRPLVGVIYCTDQIGGNTHRGSTPEQLGGIKGVLVDNYVANGEVVNANSWTIATNFTSSKNAYITNNLTYEHEPVLKREMAALGLSLTDAELKELNKRSAALGIMAGNIYIPKGIMSDDNYDHDIYSANVRGALTVNDLVVNGSFMAVKGKVEVDYSDSIIRGKCIIVGGTIVKTYANIGQYNPSTMQVVKGYLEKYIYDERMAEDPLTTFADSNVYRIMSWQYGK